MRKTILDSDFQSQTTFNNKETLEQESIDKVTWMEGITADYLDIENLGFKLKLSPSMIPIVDSDNQYQPSSTIQHTYNETLEQSSWYNIGVLIQTQTILAWKWGCQTEIAPIQDSKVTLPVETIVDNEF